VEQQERAGSLIGWLRREVKDVVKQQLPAGVQEFDARVVLHVCPECLACAGELTPVGTHPDVLAFVEQAERDLASLPIARRSPPL
jgi:hypothetical protein